MEKYINEYILPRLQGDGGHAEFVSFENNILTLTFRGECSKCLILDRCCDWICQRVKADMNLDIKIVPIRKKPYFQDK